jgi:S-formylglutathione hydrolase FrmB
MEEYLIGELMPDIFGRFKLDPARMGIMGISMGGHGALTLAIKNPGLFKSLGSLSGVTDIASHGQGLSLDRFLRLEDVLGPYNRAGGLWQDNSAYHLTRRNPELLKGKNIYLSVGLSDKLVLAENRQYSRLLKDLGIVHEYREESGGHSWTLWSQELPKQLVFMKDTL